MRVLDYIEKLRMLTLLLKMEKTGSLKQIGKRMEIDRYTVYNYMNELRAMGAQIEYDRKRNTYYLKNTFDIQLIINN